MSLLVIISIAFLIVFSFILYQYSSGKYSSLGNEFEEKNIKSYESDYPNQNGDELKIEIEKIADRLINNQNSNRYTNQIKDKVQKDERIDPFRNQIADDVKIIRYNNNKLKAKVMYSLENEKYSLIFDMITVNRGRVFLKKYNLMKQKIKNEYNM